MSARRRRIGSLLAMASVGAAACAWAGCAQIFGIDSADAVSAPGDGGTPGDASQATDATAKDASSYLDVTVRDAAGEDADASIDASMSSDAGDGSAVDACTAILARMLSAPIVPPKQWAGVDLSGGFSDIPGSGGATLAQVGVAACAAWVEPTTLPVGTTPVIPGYRESVFGEGDAASTPILFFSNMQSSALFQVEVTQGYTGTVSFHSRDGGDSYEIGIGFVHKNGQDFPADWQEDAGPFVQSEPDGGYVPAATPRLNELYDALIATFSPGTPALSGDCASSSFYGYFNDSLQAHWQSCIAITDDVSGVYLFGVRPLSLYIGFNPATSQTAYMYSLWWGGTTSCGTGIANAERMDYAQIAQPPYGGLGGINQDEYGSSPLGLTATEANELECNGTPVSAPDPGYAGIEWGQNGEVLMEYALDSGINYRLFARHGYEGFLYTGNDPGLTVGIGVPMQLGTTDYVIDWSDAGLNTSVTTLSNQVCYVTDTDCVAAGDCTIELDAGYGGSYVGFPCGGPADQVGFVFPPGTSQPSEIFVTNTLLP